MLTDTWPQQVWLLTGTGRDSDRSAASCPWSQSTFTSEHAMHSTHSALTVQPSSEHCPHSITARPSHQQQSLGAVGHAPLLNKASSEGGPTPELPHAWPHLSRLWFPHENKPLHNPTTTRPPGSQHSSASDSDLPSGAGYVRPRHCACDKPQDKAL